MKAFAPGRVNLIGDHTDHAGGWCLPMAIPLGTTVSGAPGGDGVRLRSADADDRFERFVAAVAAEVGFVGGFEGEVTTTLPIGAGLSSSASLEVAVALALGFDGPPLELARRCRRAEQAATGVPCGLMDQLSSALGGVQLLDCRAEVASAVDLPDDVDVVVVDSGQRRSLAGSAYAERQAQCEEAAARIGPLRDASAADVGTLDGVLQRRARHVVTENARVLAFVDALGAGDLAGAGRLLGESHASLRDDFEVSTPVLDDLVASLVARPGVWGARLTGAGFGGSVVALVSPGADVPGLRVRPAPGAA